MLIIEIIIFAILFIGVFWISHNDTKRIFKEVEENIKNAEKLKKYIESLLDSEDTWDIVQGIMMCDYDPTTGQKFFYYKTRKVYLEDKRWKAKIEKEKQEIITKK